MATASDSHFRRRRQALSVGGGFLTEGPQGSVSRSALPAQSPPAALLPGDAPRLPSYDALARGALRVRLFPTQKRPCLQHYINLKAGASCANFIAAVDRYGLTGSWALMERLPDEGLQQFIDTSLPLCCYFTMTAIQHHQLENNPLLLSAMDMIEQRHAGFYTFGVCEWENSFYRHWEPETDTTAIYGATPAELGRMDRKGNYEVLQRTVLRWKTSARNRMIMANGHAMLSHIAEVGVDAIGIETSEVIHSTQVKRAFVRGAARQFGIPWFEEVSVWFGASVSGGMPTASIVHWPNTPVGGDAGHSVSHMMRYWFTSWFSGAGHIMLEASPQVLFEITWGREFPADARLSRYGVEARCLATLMRRLDIGVPYTPFAVLVSKYHVRWAVWGKPWGRLDETPGDRMTERFFDQLFPGQSQGPGKEERYLCPSPYGDTFDVLVNDADRTAWSAYPVILALGDIPWTAADIAFLQRYVQDGGVLVLNELHLDGWDRNWLGLASAGFAPAKGARIVLRGTDDQPLIIHRRVRKGHVLVARYRPDTPYPEELLRSLAARYLPFRVDGDVQTLINRTKDGWAVMVVNNKGITKELHTDRPPAIDPAATQSVRIVLRRKPRQVFEAIYHSALRMDRNDTGAGQQIGLDIPPGELRLLVIRE